METCYHSRVLNLHDLLTVYSKPQIRQLGKRLGMRNEQTMAHAVLMHSLDNGLTGG